MQFNKRIFTYLCIISCLILIFLPTSGCSEADNENSSRFYELLKQLPIPSTDTDYKDTAYLQVVDYALFRQNFHVSFQTTGNSPVIGGEYFKAMIAPEGETIGVGCICCYNGSGWAS